MVSTSGLISALISSYSHNDLHPGNMMIDKEDNTGESFQLVDFDNALYGYRAFEISFLFMEQSNQIRETCDSICGDGHTLCDDNIDQNCNYDSFPNDTIQEEWIETYLQFYSGPQSDSITKEGVMEEIYYHLPYVLLERMYFLGQVGGNPRFLPNFACQYEKMQKFHNHPNPIKSCFNLPLIGKVSIGPIR